MLDEPLKVPVIDREIFPTDQLSKGFDQVFTDVHRLGLSQLREMPPVLAWKTFLVDRGDAERAVKGLEIVEGRSDREFALCL